MKTTHKFIFTSFAATALLLMAGARADARIDSHAAADIRISGTDVIITAKDDSQARISAAGDLSIRGKPVTVSAEQRMLLQQYSSGVFDMERRGMGISEQSLIMMGSAMGTLVAALLTGEDKKELDADLNAKVAPLKDQGRALCNEFKSQIVLQDKISTSLPAFKPYTVIEDDDPKGECHMDDAKA